MSALVSAVRSTLRAVQYNGLLQNTFCSHSMYHPRIALALLPEVTQIRRQIAGPPPPSPLRYVLLFCSREDFSILIPRRLASNCCQTTNPKISACLFLFKCLFLCHSALFIRTIVLLHCYFLERGDSTLVLGESLRLIAAEARLITNHGIRTVSEA